MVRQNSSSLLKPKESTIKKPKFSILSVFILTFVVALATGWILDSRSKRRKIIELEFRNKQLRRQHKEIITLRIIELKQRSGRSVLTADDVEDELDELKRQLKSLDL